MLSTVFLLAEGDSWLDNFTVIPEPASFRLLAAGGLFLMLRRRR